MIFELGYENELGRLVGPEKLKKIKSEHARHVRDAQYTHFDTAFGYRGEEYTGKEMRGRILAAYLRDRRGLIARLILTVVCLLALLVVDQPEWFGPYLTATAAAHPYLFALGGTLLLCILAWIHLRRLLSGARRLIRFTPTPYTPAAVLVLLILLYDGIRIINAESHQMPALNLCAGCALLFSLLCDCIRLGNEMRTFRLLSGDEKKTVLNATEPGKKMLRQGNKTIKIYNDDIAEQLYRVRPANETVGFFRRSNEMSSAVRPVMVLLILSLSLSLRHPTAAMLRTARSRITWITAITSRSSCLLMMSKSALPPRRAGSSIPPSSLPVSTGWMARSSWPAILTCTIGKKEW